MSVSTAPAEQRRAHYRLLTQEVEALSCQIALRDEVQEIDLIDLSEGGIGILGYIPGLLLRPGVRYHGVRIELPQVGVLLADIEIRAVQDVQLRNGIRTVRSGAQFLALTVPAQQLIQRYILQAERKRLARLHPTD